MANSHGLCPALRAECTKHDEARVVSGKEADPGYMRGILAAIYSSARPEDMTEDEIRNALRNCYDPEVPCNIVDLGLVYSVAIAPDPDAPGAGIPGVPHRERVVIGLSLTSKGCPAHTQIIAQIEGCLSAYETISRTTVELVWQPAWTPARISPAGRKLLGIDES